MSTDSLLLEYRPWLRTVAARMTHPSRVEDLAQEGWIEMWRAAKSYDGSAPQDWWLKHKAHGRMLMCVSRDWVTHKATQNVAAGHPGPEGVEGEDPVWTQLAVDLGAVELAYHHGEIHAALDVLTPREREYVFLRFWCGWRKPQMVEHFGYEPSALWRTSKAKLVTRLEHLEPLSVG